MKLFLNKELHQYFNEEGTIFTSVTTHIEKFTNKFNSKIVAQKCEEIGKNPLHSSYDKYAGKSKAEILAKWDELRIKGINRGNEIHSYLEHCIKLSSDYYNQSILGEELFTTSHIDQFDGKLDYELFKNMTSEYPLLHKLIYLLYKSGFEFYSEVGVFNEELGIAGLIDLVAIKDDKFHIIDYKTNSTPIMSVPGYFQKDFDGNIIGDFIRQSRRMKEPVRELYDSTLNKYALQVGAYDYLLESATGMKSLGNMIVHIMPEQIKLITLPRLKDEVAKMINHKYTIGFNL